MKENGVLKNIFPVAIVGKPKDLENKALKSLYEANLETALPQILCSLSINCSEVIFISESFVQDVSCKDDTCVSNKSVDITYVCDEQLMDKFEKSFM